MAEIMGALEIDGLVEQREELERLMMSNPETEKKVKYLIRKVLQGVRDDVKKAAGENMKQDPRNAAEAVKYSLYKQVLGGNVSLLNRKRAGQGNEYTPPRNPSNRGGNRRSRNMDTKRIDSYAGKDRAFILRFLNNGAGIKSDRTINFTHNPSRKETKWTKRPNTGNRGTITSRNFFSQSANMEKAAQQLAQLIDDLIKTELT